MAWTYDNALPTPKDQVRFLVGDTDASDQLLQDEEIAFLLTQFDNVNSAASRAAEAIAALYARQADEATADARVNLSQKSERYLKLADRLADAARNNALNGRNADAVIGMPYYGGSTAPAVFNRDDG